MSDTSLNVEHLGTTYLHNDQPAKLIDTPTDIVGVCAMDSKARSKPMRTILTKLLTRGDFEIIVFGDKLILDESVETWPHCDFLISFYSTGFPLEKAIDYVKLHKPIVVNDLGMQKLLQDRRLVLTILKAINVDVPYSLWSNTSPPSCHDQETINQVRDKLGIDISPESFKLQQAIQLDKDTVKIGNEVIKKPFVEKPASGEDHNVYIYYSDEMGGGVRKLFRKIGNKSSEHVPGIQNIRHDGSYLYEEFMQADNLEDVKVYTLADNYTHAETRKSPVVDGVVQRNAEGKEIRYITPLSKEEEEMAIKVAKAFGQNVCGFDLLRANGKSYVIDVNGWSFVKGNEQYYDKCAEMLANLFTKEAMRRNVQKSFSKQLTNETTWRLKAFVSVLRHGDRTPKQKVKFSFKSKPFFDLLNGLEEEVILKKEQDLNNVIQAAHSAKELSLEDVSSLEQLIMIMEKKKEFPGTKVQLKPNFNKSTSKLEKLQLIVKWGGEYTHAGRHQSKDLAENLRKDLILMNKHCLEDVLVYSSSERRCIATADIFTKYFLNSDELKTENLIISRSMLDDSDSAKEQMEQVKSKLQKICNATPKESKELLPNDVILPDEMNDPSTTLTETIELLKKARIIMKENSKNMEKFQTRWCCGDTSFLVLERWEKLFESFCDVDRSLVECSKVSELYDSLKFDALHNRDFLLGIFGDDFNVLRQLWYKARNLFDFVAPQEYGLEKEDKLEIGVLSDLPLLKQIVKDLEDAKNSATPCTRLFFTKESKIITLLNVIILCGMPVRLSYSPKEVDEVDYLTQIVFELYERKTGNPIDDSRSNTPSPREYSIRMSFSPGAHDANLVDTHLDAKHTISVQPRRPITDHVNLDVALSYLKKLIKS